MGGAHAHESGHLAGGAAALPQSFPRSLAVSRGCLGTDVQVIAAFGSQGSARTGASPPEACRRHGTRMREF